MSTATSIEANIRIRLRADRAAGENGSTIRSIAKALLIEIRTRGRNTVNQDPVLRTGKISGGGLPIQEKLPAGGIFPPAMLPGASDRQRLNKVSEALVSAELRQHSSPDNQMPLRGWIEGEETPE